MLMAYIEVYYFTESEVECPKVVLVNKVIPIDSRNGKVNMKVLGDTLHVDTVRAISICKLRGLQVSPLHVNNENLFCK